MSPMGRSHLLTASHLKWADTRTTDQKREAGINLAKREYIEGRITLERFLAWLDREFAR